MAKLVSALAAAIWSCRTVRGFSASRDGRCWSALVQLRAFYAIFGFLKVDKRHDGRGNPYFWIGFDGPR